MNDTERVLAAVESDATAGRPFALATIVDTSGSTYRHPGARLLVRPDGTWIGNLSGGCLEGEVIDVGQRVIDTGEPELVSYDLTADEEAIWGWGLGCNGAIEVLVEPAPTATAAVEHYRRGQSTGRPFLLVTALSSSGDVETADHVLVTETGTEGRGPLAAAARELATERGTRIDQRGPLRLFVEEVRPPLRLLVCGAGHDAVPVVRDAAQLGWAPVVVDDRSMFLTEERFPDATAFVHCEPTEAAAAAEADDLTYVVVMSHNFLRDVDYLRSFLGVGVAYLGMLGPARRLERLLDHLAHEGVEPSPEDLEVLHGPAGLDLGAEGPEEIAWAICAEILATARGRSGAPLRQRERPIHDRS